MFNKRTLLSRGIYFVKVNLFTIETEARISKMQAWFKRIIENKPVPQSNLVPQPYMGLSPKMRDLLIRAVTAETREQRQAIYWESIARRGDAISNKFTVPSDMYDESHEHMLSSALAKAGFRGIVCYSGTCSREVAPVCNCPDKYDYAAMVQENADYHDLQVLDMVGSAVHSHQSIRVSGAHGICHITAAMVIYEHARTRGHVNAYDDRISYYGFAGNGDTPEHFKQKLENYCREHSYDIV